MGTMLRAVAIGTAMVAIAAGTTTAGSGQPTSAPAPCSPAGVASLLTGFFSAFNRGDANAAVRIMDPQAGPRNIRPRGWYSLSETDSTGPGRQHAFYRRAALV